ncbi:MAG: hypothetical protein UV38_C0003G0118 [candidate division TM6 bacterium GW2011_GWE2_42_60]|nr:MAG: hypothetical protein UV38_C0003G0118 [candidate division TM6 bacterium GW2011_GWE2_42_60]HBY05403.1 hypothetical protein [Candidatus Dependentiae bacterium]
MENRRNSILTGISTFLRSLRGKKRLVLVILCAGFSLALFGAVYSAIVADESTNKPLPRHETDKTPQTTRQNQPSQPNKTELSAPERIVRNNPFKDYEFPRQATIDPEIEEYRSSEVECRECKGPITQYAEKQWEKTPAKREDQDLITLPKEDAAKSKDENTTSPDDARRNALMNIPDGFGSNGYQSNSVPRYRDSEHDGYCGAYSSPNYSSPSPSPRNSQPTNSSPSPETRYSGPSTTTPVQNDTGGSHPSHFVPSQGLGTSLSHDPGKDMNENKKAAAQEQHKNKEDGSDAKGVEEPANPEKEELISGEKLNNNLEESNTEEDSDQNLGNTVTIQQLKNFDDLKLTKNDLEKIKNLPPEEQRKAINNLEEQANTIIIEKTGETDLETALPKLSPEDQNKFTTFMNNCESLKNSIIPFEQPGLPEYVYKWTMDFMKKNRAATEIIRNMTAATGTALFGALGSTMLFGTPFLPFFLTGVGGTLAACLGWTGLEYLFGKKQEEEFEDEDLEKVKFEEVEDKAEVVVQTIPTQGKTVVPTAFTKAGEKLFDAAYWVKSWINFYLPKKPTA